MDTGISILTLSLAMQVAAAFQAFRLIRLTGNQFAWGLIAVGLFLMAVRRGITWFHIVVHNEPFKFDLTAELTALAISALMLVGVILIGRLFQNVQKDRQRLMTAVGHMPVLLDAFDAQGNVIFWNHACESVTGYSAEEIVGNPKALDLLYPDEAYRDWVVSTIRKEDGDFSNLDFELTTKSGEKRTVSWSNISDTVVVPGWATWAIGIDITDQKLAESRLHQSIDELSRSNTELERFAFIVSHDLQEPTRSMVNHSQLLARHLGPRLSGDDKETLDFVTDSAKRMNDLVRDILNYSRAGRSTDAFVSVDLSEAYAEAIANLDASIVETGTEVWCDSLPHVNGNPTQLTQLLQNLIANAIKFRAPGRPCRIVVSAESDGDMWRVGVRDNGIGIDPKYHAQIFDIFRRLHTAADYPGTGVGLAVAKRIVERHGGTIGVDSTPGEGTTFHFTLPSAT